MSLPSGEVLGLWNSPSSALTQGTGESPGLAGRPDLAGLLGTLLCFSVRPSCLAICSCQRPARARLPATRARLPTTRATTRPGVSLRFLGFGSRNSELRCPHTALPCHAGTGGELSGVQEGQQSLSKGDKGHTAQLLKQNLNKTLSCCWGLFKMPPTLNDTTQTSCQDPGP